MGTRLGAFPGAITPKWIYRILRYIHFFCADITHLSLIAEVRQFTLSNSFDFLRQKNMRPKQIENVVIENIII